MKKMTRKRFIILLITLAFLLCAGLLAGRFLLAGDKTTYITPDVTRMDLEESILASR